MRIFENLNVDFIAKRKTAYIISTTLFIIGLVSLFVNGLQLGIDFKGGTEVALQFEKPINIGDVRDYLIKAGIGNTEVKTFGGETGVLVRTDMQEIPAVVFSRVLIPIEDEIRKGFPEVTFRRVDSTSASVTYEFPVPEVTNEVTTYLESKGFQSGRVSQEAENLQMIVRVGITDWIEEIIREKLPDNSFSFLKEDNVGPKIGQELKRDAIIAVLLALLVILIYLGFRFKFIFALGAVLALFHDVFITLGMFALLHKFIPWLNLEISVNVVAAFLTLVGYSINDTVIVFDRIREYLKIHKTAELKDNINRGINRTMSRTIITSGTTMLVVAVLLIFGGDVLRSFAFALTFGILIGTYSSIFVASTFVYEYATKYGKKIQF